MVKTSDPKLPRFLHSNEGAIFEVLWHKYRNGTYSFTSYRLDRSDIERRYR